MYYSAATILVVLGASYAAVPMYRAFCSATGFAGTPMTDPSKYTADRLIPTEESVTNKRITVRFAAEASDMLPWKFTPQQKEIKVLPGESALAFYTATNKSDQDIIGIATYNVTPGKIAPYFAKVECFCFEEQRLLAGETVDLPILFFVDRDFLDDPSMRGVDDIVLNYVFFKAKHDRRGQLVPVGVQDGVDVHDISTPNLVK
ncbi:hypothetical protein E3P92_03957 [Wallemia ichthyophaga]|uniref:Cytochrome c oxidase assembly protein COX11 n=2 Tax=Wallemia ichthyophaga TaxID=245174 RepID=A0A4T0FHE7_WALIC|nr:uncharacterized protein J056_000371 [Wallemia ichthyophaga EXF-994]TIA68589.1 hypothetical protein E3P91_04013 [Wallemia ichthyophaga]EOR04575.1 hypothetical protein J056_000371 [Wallemia ichthyophaga EXF-994]TIA78126.1 hypothetical protein E3P98_03970 [Wallemia ichthyophaga]TIA87360.1 hypothetical protein E3P97_03975 [Wallemia ichthyophaga]TIA94945.1 hypothetical protein E3P95_03970 [Wallemia ichthyophaga]